jgi:hypothetical protein
MASPQRTVVSFFAQAVIVLLFLLISTAVIVSANGYYFNQNTFRFEETGVITLDVKNVPVTVRLDDVAKDYTREEIPLPYLLPGQYTVAIEKAGYFPWTKTFQLQAGEAVTNPWIVLFPSNTLSKIATPEQKAQLAEDTSSKADYTDMDVRGNELWVKPVVRTYPIAVPAEQFELIGRYSNPINQAIWYEGRNRIRSHIMFQLDREIHIIERDGSNDTLLATLGSDTSEPFTVTSDGKTLIYQDGDTVYQKAIQ